MPWLLRCSPTVLLIVLWPHAFGDVPLDCWDGVYTYDLCCGCGNDGGNRTGLDICWGGDFTFESCCRVYGKPQVLPNLPCWRDAQGPKFVVELDQLGGVSWKLPQRPGYPYDVKTVMPYVLWPSGYALAAWIFDMPKAAFNDRRVIELGCGVGLPSMAAALSEADVLATDIDRQAVDLALLAAQRNLPAAALARFKATPLDFRDKSALVGIGTFDLILIAGQLYSKSLQEPLLEAIRVLCGTTSEGLRRPRPCSVMLAAGGSRQLSADLWYGFPHSIAFLEALERDFTLNEFFLCSKRGYTGPYSGFGCFSFSSA